MASYDLHSSAHYILCITFTITLFLYVSHKSSIYLLVQNLLACRRIFHVPYTIPDTLLSVAPFLYRGPGADTCWLDETSHRWTSQDRKYHAQLLASCVLVRKFPIIIDTIAVSSRRCCRGRGRRDNISGCRFSFKSLQPPTQYTVTMRLHRRTKVVRFLRLIGYSGAWLELIAVDKSRREWGCLILGTFPVIAVVVSIFISEQFTILSVKTSN